jgi:hypothetical protein
MEKNKETRDTLDREEVTKERFFTIWKKAKKQGIPWTEVTKERFFSLGKKAKKHGIPWTEKR